MKRLLALLALALLAPLPARAVADEGPDYRLPETLRTDAEPSALVLRQVEVLVEERGGEADDAWRILGGIGRPAVPATVAALPRAAWFSRSLLVDALAESGVPEVEPVLATAAADPAWAVREAAVVGLTKLDTPSAARALLGLAGDPSWRVRRAVATGLRMHVTRGTLPRETALPILLALGRDPDRDVHLGAVVELGLLRAGEALEIFLAGYRDGDEREMEACLDALVRLPDAREELLAALREAMRSADDEEFLKAAVKYAELAGAEFLDEPGRTHRLLDRLENSSGSLTEVTKAFEAIGPPAVPLLLEELRKLYRTPRQIPPTRDPAIPVLDTVQAVLGADAAPVLRTILLEWEEALPARRYAVVLARRFHAKALTKTLTESFMRESFADLRAALLEAIAAASPPDLDVYVRAALADPNYHVRTAAIETLTRHRDMELDDAIVEAALAEETYPRIANRVMNLLARRDRARGYEVAKAYLARPDPDFREVGAAGIRLAPDAAELVRVATEAFGAEDGRHRERRYDLPEERVAASRARVIAMLLDSAVAGAKDAALPLLERAVTDPDPVVREKALAALARVEGPEATRIAIAALARERDPLPLREARRAVVGRDAPEARELVARALSGDDVGARIGMLEALRAVATAPVPPVVVEALESGAWEADARALAAEVLRARRDPAYVPVFVKLVRQGRIHDVRTEAVGALGESGDPRAADALIALLPAPGRSLDAFAPEEQQLASLALLALGELREASAVPRLLALLSVEWPLALTDTTKDRRHFDAVVQALGALGRIGDPRAIPPLLDLLFTPEIHRWFGLTEAGPAARGRNLLGTLLAALVRFPDEVLAPAAREAIAGRLESGEAWRIDEGYLGYLSSVFRDPRRERVARNRPRRALAAEIDRLVLAVVPRRSAADAAALENLVNHAVASRNWARAAELKSRTNEFRRVLDPVGFEEDGAAWRAETDFYRGLALVAEGREEEGFAVYDQGLRHDPEDADVLNLYAWFLAVDGHRLETALETALAAGRRAPSAAYVLDTIGWVYHALGREEEAWWKLLDARRLDMEQAEESGGARHPEPLYPWHLAAVASAAGHLDSAEDWLTAALELDDTLADAARASPDFAALRESGRLEALVRRVLSED